MANLAQMIEFSGATRRQIDHWTRLGYLRTDLAAEGQGTRRVWSDGEDVVARVLLRLTAAGVNADVAERVARGEIEIGPGVFVFVNPNA